MFEQAEQIGENNLIEVQAQPLRGPGRLVQLDGRVGRDEHRRARRRSAGRARARRHRDGRSQLMTELADSTRADPSLSTSDEDSSRLAFEAGSVELHDQLPLRLPEREGERARGLQAAREALSIRAVDAGKPVEAAARRDQPRRLELLQAQGGVPSTRSSACASRRTRSRSRPPAACRRSREGLYDSKAIDDVYPGFADLMRKAIDNAAPRPVTPAYQDLSLAIQRSIHPLDDIDPDDLAGAVDELRDNVETALERGGPALMGAAATPGRHARAKKPKVTRSRQGRAAARLDAVRAGGAGDAAGHRLSDRLRGRPQLPALRPALPGRARVRRAQQLRRRAHLAAVVAGRRQHPRRHGRLGRRSSSCSAWGSRCSCTGRSSVAA